MLLLFHSLTDTGHVSHVCGKLKLVSLSLNTTEIYAPTLMLGMLKPGLKVMLYSLPANTFMNLPLRSALGTSKFSFTSVWTGDELARGPAPNSASPVMSRESFLLLEPHFRSLLTSSFLSVPSRLTWTLLSSRKLGLSHLFFQVIVVVRDLPLERVWVVVNLLSVMVKSPLPS